MQSKALWLISLLYGFLYSSSCFFAADTTDDIKQLTRNVQKISSPGTPGQICVFGEKAFVVVVGNVDDGVVMPVVGASRLGKGRVVVFGHSGYLGDLPTHREHDTAKFFQNSMSWAAGGRENPKITIIGDNEFKGRMKSIGLTFTENKLAASELLIANPDQILETDVERIVSFIRNGGGLITAETGWGWKQLNPNKSLYTGLIANRILNKAGLAIADGTLNDNAPDGFFVGKTTPEFSHAGKAFSKIESQLKGGLKPGGRNGARQISTSIVGAMNALPRNESSWVPRVLEFSKSQQTSTIPSSKKPIELDNAPARIAMVIQSQDEKTLPPMLVKANPAAKIFPGFVPAEVKRLESHSLNLNTGTPGWHSTGLYAAPGEIVRFKLPIDALDMGLVARIGCHSDTLWELDSWPRHPDITRSFPLKRASTNTACSFGGLVYVEVTNPRKKTVNIEISGAVEAPTYFHGKTTVEDWKATIRNRKAPWGELVTDKVILTLPSESLRKLENPKPLMDYWNRILDLDAELAGIPKNRPRPERIICDEQISAGYMHAGYPIMTLMDQKFHFANLADLQKPYGYPGNWGIFHELGHNHQVDAWTFEGTGEVTCNIFSFYIMDKLCGVPPKDFKDGNSEKFIEHYKVFLKDGKPNFQKWKSDPGLALCMYAQLQKEFGWDAYKKVFAAYHSLKPEDMPKNDLEKRDLWMVMFSKNVNRNLGPFFRAWGIPVSKKALESIQNMSPWIPPEMKELVKP